jgi:hypothetical protein
MKNALLIKTFGRNLETGNIVTRIICEDNVESVEPFQFGQSAKAKLWMVSGAFYIDLRYSFDSWVTDVYKRENDG